MFQISKKQHDLFKNMDQSGRSIQSKSLTRVLGDINTLHVQPYEEYLPVSYATRREIQSQKWRITKSLEQEMKEKLNSLLEDEEDEDEDTLKLQDQEENVDTNLVALDVEEEDPEKSLEDEKDTKATESESSMEDGESVLALPPNQSPQRISSIDSGQLCNHMEESENNENIAKSDVASSDVSEHLDNLNTVGATIGQEVPVSSAEIVWPADSIPHSYHDSTADHKYTSTSGLPFIHQDTDDQQNQMIALESDLHKESTSKALLYRHSEDGPFNSHTNQDRNELLQSFFKDQGVSSYHSEQKQAGPDFQPPKILLMEDGHFNGQFQEQLQSSLLLEEKQKRQNDVYMQQNMPQNIYPDGGRYMTPRQEHLPSGNMQDWASIKFKFAVNGLVQMLLVAKVRFIPQRNNGMMRGVTPGIIGNGMQQAAHPFDYLGTRGTTTPLMAADDPRMDELATSEFCFA
ncbi:Detected protein of unknown function [Hibiscus syriacus]|uniref:Uncharacterized protein n=1 Tax=Hibiscus syriacus TaxID=106335 RepID=A0A6A3CLV8_HIBSY|nr:Detected protein of unknown function [Hibiscus syriacus]